MIIFYARCSTAEQNEARQLGDAHACHAEKIYIDKASGKNRDQYTSTVELENGNLEGKIEIPFAIDRRGRMTSIELGSPNYAHGLISGATGSGKSTMLHMIINSVVMNYHPEDVEIWLVDYKKIEFSVYIEDRPPHVKFIGIERNEEFTFSLLDLITEEYERRLDVFRQENVRNIDLYKKKRGMHSMARILLIIDEFHLMQMS